QPDLPRAWRFRDRGSRLRDARRLRKVRRDGLLSHHDEDNGRCYSPRDADFVSRHDIVSLLFRKCGLNYEKSAQNA
ncbi:hypothetical protein, partial [Mesorhizobium sp. M0772]|uniref:hypothetical protein n=1 Tax=Mesorhizobium sp. M0772 TaxID=2956998 RepID=UPI003339927C